MTWNEIVNRLTNLPVYFLTSLGIMVFIMIISIWFGARISKLDVEAKPNKLWTVVIQFVAFFNTFTKSYFGKHWRKLTPLVFAMTLYVALANMSGMFFNLTAPTRFTSITFSLSILSFLIIQTAGFMSQSWRHLTGVFQPLWPLFPLNIIGDFTPIFSMALRLFGNIVSGSIILFLVYELGGWVSVVITPALHVVFDIGFGFIQTLVLILLTVIFASNKMDEADL
ncbi:MAG: FoF1 ATP synthase subunit a [Acholeplasmataceae bacterium]|nr:F0F1 ATP synthase subunit A [Acholeplasmataceae bacterium]